MNETENANKTGEKKHHVRIHIDQRQHQITQPDHG